MRNIYSGLWSWPYNVTLSRFRIWAMQLTLSLLLNSFLTLLLCLNSLLLRFGPWSWPYKERDAVTFSVLGHKVDRLRYVTLSRFRKWANGLIYSGTRGGVQFRTAVSSSVLAPPLFIKLMSGPLHEEVSTFARSFPCTCVAPLCS